MEWLSLWANRTSNKKVGSIQVAIDLLDESEAAMVPFSPLTHEISLDCEIRVVIWSLTNIPFPDDDTRSVFVRLIPKQETEDDSDELMDTDVHHNAENNTAEFNWRFVFNAEIYEGYVKRHEVIFGLQIWSSNLVTSNELLAETEYAWDMQTSALLETVKSDANRTRMVETSVSVPATSGDRKAEVRLSISVVSKAEAQLYPVGVGRDEPNRDPHVEQILDHRDFLAESMLGKFAIRTTSTLGRSFTFIKWTILCGVIIYTLSTLKNLITLT